MMMSPSTEPVIPEEMAETPKLLHYSPGRWAGNLLLISGQTGVDEDGNVPDDIAEEATVAFERLRRVLETAGLTTMDIVSMTSYHVCDVTTLHNWFAPVRDTFLKSPWPTWTAVGVASLADANARIEISAVACSPKNLGGQ
jgi:enamine deaminase RidA (YjgF/YER057c/UK114 family)